MSDTSARVMPHNLDAERSVLGAILIDNAAYAIVAPVLDTRAFFRDAHARIYRHLVALANGNQPIDLVILKESLARTGELDEVGGPAYIASLIDGVPYTTNVAHYAQIVHEHWTKRTLIANLTERIEDAYGWHGPVVELLDRVAENATSLTTSSSCNDPHLFITAVDTCRDQEHVPMLLAPYLPAGSIGSLIAKVKAGKTSAMLEMVRCLRQGIGFCGFAPPPSRARVLYCTEQPRTSFVKQLHDAGLHGDDGLVVTYLSAWKGRPWAQIAPALIEMALAHGTPSGPQFFQL